MTSESSRPDVGPHLPDERPVVPGHRLDAVLGAGASSVVWSGHDAAGHPVAVKVPHRARDAVDARQSEVERQVLTAVRHDHLVSLRSVVPLDDGREALVFDLVQGVTLRALVRTRGHLRPAEVVTVLTPLSEAVAHLHGAAGLHGDISPSNVTVTAQGKPVLLDLGAARVAGQLPGAPVGTPGFVAPEMRLGSEAGEAADVYSLGALAWFCVTGNGAPDTLSRLDPDTVESHVGPELAGVVAACIDPDPDLRPGAAEAARLFYEAAPAEPLEVVVGADVASALTHRLRAEAVREAPAPSTGARRSWALWRGRSAGSRARSRAGWSAWRAAWRAGHARAAAALIVAAPVLAVAGWAVAARHSAAAPAPAAEANRAPGVSAAPAPAAAETTEARVTTDPARGTPAGTATRADALLAAPTSPSAHPEDLLQVLSDRRAAALVARDLSALPGVHRAGSPSAASDRVLVARLRDARLRWVGLRLEVAEAAFVSGTADEAVLRARVDWTGYDVVGQDGSTQRRPPDTGRRLDFTLARGVDGWRIASVSDAPAT